MEIGRTGSDMEMDREDDDDEETLLLRDRFRLSAISIVESEGPFSFINLLSFFKLLNIYYSFVSQIYAAKKNGMQVSEPIVACLSNLAFNYAGSLRFILIPYFLLL